MRWGDRHPGRQLFGSTTGPNYDDDRDRHENLSQTKVPSFLALFLSGRYEHEQVQPISQTVLTTVSL